MTILYNSEKHLFLLFSTKGTVWPSVLPFCILSVIITAVGYVAHEHFPYRFDITFPKEAIHSTPVLGGSIDRETRFLVRISSCWSGEDSSEGRMR